MVGQARLICYTRTTESRTSIKATAYSEGGTMSEHKDECKVPTERLIKAIPNDAEIWQFSQDNQQSVANAQRVLDAYAQSRKEDKKQ
jgi:hypothetical protein